MNYLRVLALLAVAPVAIACDFACAVGVVALVVIGDARERWAPRTPEGR